jgi:muconate cycloisomerase
MQTRRNGVLYGAADDRPPLRGPVIRAVEVLDVALPLRRGAGWRGLHERLGRVALVRVEDDTGTVGWGEATALASWGGDHGRRGGETPATVRHVVETLLGPAVVGLEPFALQRAAAAMEARLRGHTYAKAAVETALWDLQGRLVGRPVHELLGGAVREGVVIAHMLGLQEQAAAVRDARAVAQAGGRAVQVKLAGDPGPDAALVAAVREAVGPGVVVRADVNQGYARLGAKAATAATRALHAAGAELVEQPVEGAAAMAAVRGGTEALVVADESVWGPHDALELAAAGAADALSIYLAKAGGIAAARRVADLADALGLPCDVNGSLETGVGNAANVQFAVAARAVTLPCVIPVTAPDGRHAGPVGAYFADDVVAEPFPFADGVLRPPSGPGLGIDVDEERVRALRPG